MFSWLSYNPDASSWMKLLLHLVLFFALHISLFLLLCEVILNQFTGVQVWDELFLLRNYLSCPSKLVLRALSWLAWLPHTARDEARRPRSFELQIQTQRISEICPFKLLSATALLVQHCSQPWCLWDVLSPTTGFLACISTGSTESLSKQKVMKEAGQGTFPVGEDADVQKPRS